MIISKIVGVPTSCFLIIVKSSFDINPVLNSELKSEKLKNQVLEIKVLNLENKQKNLSLAGETHLDKIVSNYDKMEQMKARDLKLTEIIKPKEKVQEEVKENTNAKRQNYGYELR